MSQPLPSFPPPHEQSRRALPGAECSNGATWMHAASQSRSPGAGLLCDVSILCAVVPPPGLYGVVSTGLLWGVSTLCDVVPPSGLDGVVGTGLLCDVSTLCAVVPPA